MRIGIMGGTFNPPHNGHINAANAANAELCFDKLLFIPTGIPPHKAMAEGSASPEDRLHMTELIAKRVGGAVSNIEMLRGGKSYTADTLSELRKTYKDDELWLIMGTDMFLSIEKWYQADKIMKLANIAAVPRNHADKPLLYEHSKALKEKYGACSCVIETTAIEISSSELRMSIENGKLSEFLPREVYDYIIRKGLFKTPGER